jgi:GH18 family chitinase
MTIERFYKVQININLPIDHEFPSDVRSAVFNDWKDEITNSDLLLEEIRQALTKAGLLVESLSVGLNSYRVIDEITGTVLQEKQ